MEPPVGHGSLYLAVAFDSHWRRVCAVVDRSDLAEAPGFTTNVERLMNREAVGDAIGIWCANLSVHEALGRSATRLPGADNEDVPAELGYDSDRTAGLRAERVV